MPEFGAGGAQISTRTCRFGSRDLHGACKRGLHIPLIHCPNVRAKATYVLCALALFNAYRTGISGIVASRSGSHRHGRCGPGSSSRLTFSETVGISHPLEQ